MHADFTNNQLRALGAFILLVLAVTTIAMKQTTATMDFIMVALASFLVGGAILSQLTTKNP